MRAACPLDYFGGIQGRLQGGAQTNIGSPLKG
jgi:hypothetical protein